MRNNQFRRDIEKAIQTAIANLDQGTVGISQDNLWQLTAGYIRSNCAPANAPWAACTIFREIVTHKPYSGFVYTPCDKCGEANPDSSWANYCPTCREFFHTNSQRERERTQKANDKFWANKPE